MIITAKAVGLICMILAFAAACGLIYGAYLGAGYLWVTFG